MAKQALVNAPVRAYPIPGLGYRLYSDACDTGIACILQQVQPIKISDLKGTKVYDRLRRAYTQKEPPPQLVPNLSKIVVDVPEAKGWADNFEDTVVHVERVIAYWSRTLRSAERNYSPTEREALALKEGLIKFQPLIEGEKVIAITDHAALIWSKTFQNVNRRLLSWGTVFAAYPDLHIVHRAGRVHSNVDPISRLRRRVPRYDAPLPPSQQHAVLNSDIANGVEQTLTEIGADFEERVLRLCKDSEEQLQDIQDGKEIFHTTVTVPTELGNKVVNYTTASSYNILVHAAKKEVKAIHQSYLTDSHFSRILTQLEEERNTTPPIPRSLSKHPQYVLGDDGLLYFSDWAQRQRLCVGKSEQLTIMTEIHESVTDAAHAGYHRMYNRLAMTYYWPRMSRDIRTFVQTCDVCQKIKPSRRGPAGLLQPLPIPSRPFEVVTMDFIPELPEANQFDSILVIVDKLTKYAIFTPTHTTDTSEDTARLFSHHIVAHYGMPKQIISDRDRLWSNQFWKEICTILGATRLLSTSYHPQTDGQTEVMNQTLEIMIRAYVNEELSDWNTKLDSLMLAYNTAIHTATGFSPAFLLRGFQPTLGGNVLNQWQNNNYIDRSPNTTGNQGEMFPSPEQSQASNQSGRSADGNSDTNNHEQIDGDTIPILDEFESPAAESFIERFMALRGRAQDALRVSQAYQERSYNKGRLLDEFKEGENVMIDLQNMNLFRDFKGRGQKLLQRYEGPFEIMEKISPVAYRLRLPSSYRIHPVINIANLVRYHDSPPSFPPRAHRPSRRLGFDELEEKEIERILAAKYVKKNGRRQRLYRVRWVGFDESHDEWKTRAGLKNAPLILREWEALEREQKKNSSSNKN